MRLRDHNDWTDAEDRGHPADGDLGSHDEKEGNGDDPEEENKDKCGGRQEDKRDNPEGLAVSRQGISYTDCGCRSKQRWRSTSYLILQLLKHFPGFKMGVWKSKGLSYWLGQNPSLFLILDPMSNTCRRPDSPARFLL